MFDENYFPFEGEDEVWMIRNLLHNGNTVISDKVVRYYKEKDGEDWKDALIGSLEYEVEHGTFRLWSKLINGLEIWFAEAV